MAKMDGSTQAEGNKRSKAGRRIATNVASRQAEGNRRKVANGVRQAGGVFT